MNTLNGKPVKLAGNKPVLTIMFGNTAAGVYRMFLFDPNNKNPKLFGQGLSNDTLPDTWPVPVTAPPQAVHLEFSAHPFTAVDSVPVTLVLTEKGQPYWTHTYVVAAAEFNKGLVDFFFLTN
jgi:hypothetical protein